MDYDRELMEEIKKIRDTREVRAVDKIRPVDDPRNADSSYVLAKTEAALLHHA